MKILFTIVWLFALTSCTTKLVQPTNEYVATNSSTGMPVSENEGWHSYIDENFIIEYPPALKYKIVREKRSLAITTSKTPQWDKNVNDYFMSIEETLPSQNCKNIGASKTAIKTFNNAEVVIGKIDAVPWDQDPIPVPNCMIGKNDLYTSSYILCSEKNNVQVAICIVQVTDNPQLAEEIFRTFKWTD